MSLPILDILAKGEDDAIKLLFAVGFGLVWIVLAIVGAIAKNKPKPRQRSWDEILGQLSGQQRPPGVPPPMPGRAMPPATPSRPKSALRPPPLQPSLQQPKAQKKRRPVVQSTLVPPPPPPPPPPAPALQGLPPVQSPQPTAKRPAIRSPWLGTAPGLLKKQIIAAEVLGKPIALRDE